MAEDVAVIDEIDRDAEAFAAFLACEGKTAEAFEGLLKRIHAFITMHRAVLATVLLRMEGRQLYITLGLRENPFDFALADRESDFLLDLCHTHHWSAVHMMQWPGNPDAETLRYASSNAAGEARDGG